MSGYLTQILRGRKAPLMIDISNGVIVAASFEFGGPYEFGVVFSHPEGDIASGFDRPTNAEHWGLDTPAFASLSYEEKMEKIMDQVGDTPGNPSAGDGEESLAAWLSEKIDWEQAENLSAKESEYTPGFEIMDALPDADRARLGLGRVDVGGPASGGCWVVKTSATPDELDAALAANDLPFRVGR
jgi:hypothetical protein